MVVLLHAASKGTPWKGLAKELSVVARMHGSLPHLSLKTGGSMFSRSVRSLGVCLWLIG